MEPCRPSYSRSGVCSRDARSGEAGVVHDGALIAMAGRISGTPETLLGGQHAWARGYFWATVGAVHETTIKNHIDDPRWDDHGQRFKITGPTEP